MWHCNLTLSHVDVLTPKQTLQRCQTIFSLTLTAVQTCQIFKYFKGEFSLLSRNNYRRDNYFIKWKKTKSEPNILKGTITIDPKHIHHILKASFQSNAKAELMGLEWNFDIICIKQEQKIPLSLKI